MAAGRHMHSQVNTFTAHRKCIAFPPGMRELTPTEHAHNAQQHAEAGVAQGMAASPSPGLARTPPEKETLATGD